MKFNTRVLLAHPTHANNNNLRSGIAFTLFCDNLIGPQQTRAAVMMLLVFSSLFSGRILCSTPVVGPKVTIHLYEVPDQTIQLVCITVMLIILICLFIIHILLKEQKIIYNKQLLKSVVLKGTKLSSKKF